MNRIRHKFVVASALIALGTLSVTGLAFAASVPPVSGSIAGVIRDASGVPQIGIQVQLVRADSSTAAQAYTDGRGRYSFATVLPGQYALRAAGADFIPTLRQNLRIRANTIVNLTLYGLYDLMQWVPQPRRRGPESADDWAWTLRTAQSRPLLRWLPDGSPILVTDAAVEGRVPARQRRGRRRLEASTGNSHFGQPGQQVSLAMEQQTSLRRKVAMSADFAPDDSGVMQAMLGFQQQLTTSAMASSSMQTLVALMSDPQISSDGQLGLRAVTLRTWESMQLADTLEAEVGSDQSMAQLGDGFGGGTGGHSAIYTAMPFASITLQHGQSALQYRMETSVPSDIDASQIEASAWLPVLSERAGNLVMEHGLHQELGWSTNAGPTQMQLVIYGDNIENPVIEGSGQLSSSAVTGQWLLVDGASGILHATGPAYSSGGVLASFESRLPGNNQVRLSYASGDALVLQTTGKPQDIGAILQGALTRRAPMYSLALAGTTEGFGTRWRASYRWQPESTVTQIAPFALDASEPYLNVYIRQPIRVRRAEGADGLELQVDMSNLLAQGYHPFLTSDGSHLYFAQAQRCVRGGVAFIF